MSEFFSQDEPIPPMDSLGEAPVELSAQELVNNRQMAHSLAHSYAGQKGLNLTEAGKVQLEAAAFDFYNNFGRALHRGEINTSGQEAGTIVLAVAVETEDGEEEIEIDFQDITKKKEE